MDCVRSITFVIPGVKGAPDVQITAVEIDGSIEFTVEVLTSAEGVTVDLRGLFLNVNDESVLAGLGSTGSDVTELATGDVIDLGNGANMRGKAKGFDVGVEFGGPGIGKDHGDIQTTTFTLSGEGEFTLDDIANVEFGVRLTSVGVFGSDRDGSAKLTTIAPAAPDARDDSYDIFEDGRLGLDDPASVALGVQFDVLDNDTDADGDTLTITQVFGAMHGTVEIIDGDDADLLPGDAILYTPDTDYSGPDEFTYCITDNNGGTDFATVAVAIEAVADIPDVSIQAFATENVNEIRLVVTATQTDDDNSEFIRQLVSSALPEGVTLSPAGPEVMAPGQQTTFMQDYLLTLPLDTDADFELTFTATSEELSNGDTETGSATIDITYEYNKLLSAVAFEADNQSIWNSGDAFQFIDDRFLGFDTGSFDNRLDVGPFFAGLEGHIKLGFQSTLVFDGGSIDATADYEVCVETNYNTTVDELLIETSANLTDAGFMTEGPSGSYNLSFLWDILLQAYAGVEISFGELGSLKETIDFPGIAIGPGSASIIDIDSSDLAGSIDLPSPFDVLSIDFAWPEISTVGTAPPLDPVEANGASNNFLQLNLDVDQLIFTLLGVPNPLNPSVDLGPFYASLDILNVVASAGLNFLQEFQMSMGDLVGVLAFEDGSNQLFTIGDSLQISNASAIDAAGDGDGDVEYEFTVIPESELSNLTELGFNLGGAVEILSAEAGYDIFGFSDSVSLGPLFEFGFTEPIADIDVFNDTFNLAFEAEQILAYA